MLPVEFLLYFHPALATVAIVLAFFILRSGLKQRKQRLRRVIARRGSLAFHIRFGPWACALLCVSAVTGLGSAIVLRHWKPLATAHGWFGLLSMMLFVTLWWLGLLLNSQRKHLAARHGLLGVIALFTVCFTGLLGIALLP